MSDLPSIEEELSQIFPSRSPHKDKDSQSGKKVSIVNLGNNQHCKRIARSAVKDESYIVVNVFSILKLIANGMRYRKTFRKKNSV